MPILRNIYEGLLLNIRILKRFEAEVGSVDVPWQTMTSDEITGNVTDTSFTE